LLTFLLRPSDALFAEFVNTTSRKPSAVRSTRKQCFASMWRVLSLPLEFSNMKIAAMLSTWTVMRVWTGMPSEWRICVTKRFLLPIHSKQCAQPQLLTEQQCHHVWIAKEQECHSRMKWKPQWTFCCPCHWPNHCHWLQEVSIQVVFWQKQEQVLIPWLLCQVQTQWCSTFLCKQAEWEISTLLSCLSHSFPNQFWNASTNSMTRSGHLFIQDWTPSLWGRNCMPRSAMCCTAFQVGCFVSKKGP